MVEIAWKLGEEWSFENRKIGNFAKCTELPQTKLKESGITSTLNICTVVPRVPNFSPFHSTASCFQNIAHFRIYPLTPMLKFQSITNFLILPDRQNIYNFTFPCDCFIYHKVWLRLDKNCMSSVLKFSATYGPVLTKISKCHKVF